MSDYYQYPVVDQCKGTKSELVNCAVFTGNVCLTQKHAKASSSPESASIYILRSTALFWVEGISCYSSPPDIVFGLSQSLEHTDKSVFGLLGSFFARTCCRCCFCSLLLFRLPYWWVSAQHGCTQLHHHSQVQEQFGRQLRRLERLTLTSSHPPGSVSKGANLLNPPVQMKHVGCV